MIIAQRCDSTWLLTEASLVIRTPWMNNNIMITHDILWNNLQCIEMSSELYSSQMINAIYSIIELIDVQSLKYLSNLQ